MDLGKYLIITRYHFYGLKTHLPHDIEKKEANHILFLHKIVFHMNPIVPRITRLFSIAFSVSIIGVHSSDPHLFKGGEVNFNYILWRVDLKN